MNPLVFLGGGIAFLVAAATTSLFVPQVIRVAFAEDAVDYPGGRRAGTEPTPRIGGVAIAAGIVFGAALPALGLWFSSGASVTPFEIYALGFGTALIFLAGLAEDLIGVSPLVRLLLQAVAAVSVVAAGWSFDILYVPFLGLLDLGIWGPMITIIWIVGVTNAINLLDGLDGLAGGVAAIIAASLLVFAVIGGRALTIVLMAAIVGACLGFLRHNWAPAKIYMGDSGSLTLGFLLAVMSLHGSIKNAAAVAILVPILALGLPVIDTLLVMAVRFAERPHGSAVRRLARMFHADRNHLHHLMLRLGPERQHIVVTLYTVVATFCAMALVVAISRSGALGVVLVVVEIGVVLIMRDMNARPRLEALALHQRLQVREMFDRLKSSGEQQPSLGNTDERTRKTAATVEREAVASLKTQAASAGGGPKQP